MTDPRVQIVADGYDVIGETFAEWRDRIVGDPRAAWRGELVSRLPQGARVLELGCGGGVPDTQLLAERFRVTGVDVSPEQVRRASAAVPSAEFVCADFTELELDARIVRRGRRLLLVQPRPARPAGAAVPEHPRLARPRRPVHDARSERATRRAGSASGSARGCSSPASRR